MKKFFNAVRKHNKHLQHKLNALRGISECTKFTFNCSLLYNNDYNLDNFTDIELILEW